MTTYLDAGQINVWNLVSAMMDGVEREMKLNLIQKTGARLERDGNQWCYIIGELPEKNCVAAWGDSPADAMDNFWMEFHKPISKPK